MLIHYTDTVFGAMMLTKRQLGHLKKLGTKRPRLSESTRRLYRNAWSRYLTWCQERNCLALNGHEPTIAVYIGDLARRIAESSARVHVAAIAAAHRLVGLNVDTRHVSIANAVVSGTSKSTSFRNHAPLYPELFQEVLTHLKDGAIGVRDRALMVLGYWSAASSSALLALEVRDIELRESDLVLKLSQGHKSLLGSGDLVVKATITPLLCPVRAVRGWLDIRGREPGPLFVRIRRGSVITTQPLAPENLGRLIKRAAHAAGYEPDIFSGRSLTLGLDSLLHKSHFRDTIAKVGNARKKPAVTPPPAETSKILPSKEPGIGNSWEVQLAALVEQVCQYRRMIINRHLVKLDLPRSQLSLIKAVVFNEVRPRKQRVAAHRSRQRSPFETTDRAGAAELARPRERKDGWAGELSLTACSRELLEPVFRRVTDLTCTIFSGLPSDEGHNLVYLFEQIRRRVELMNGDRRYK